jgi:hypothetical protein
VERTTDLAPLRIALERFAASNHIAIEVADATTCYTIQELHYAGHKELAESLLAFLKSEPYEALFLIWALRRLLVDSQHLGPNVAYAIDPEDFDLFCCAEGRRCSAPTSLA